MSESKKLVLFDVDGTLTVPRNKITQQMIDKLRELNKYATIGCVGGSDLNKIKEQITSEVFDELDYGFSENGLMGFKSGVLFHKKSILDQLGNDIINKFVSFCIRYIADLDIPVKRGTFVEYRNGMINVSPIGRNCSQTERDEFEEYDKVHKIREKMVETVQEKFGEHFQFSIGGQISFDCVPHGWTKAYCLQFVEKEFDEIYFFGDKTYKGGNDYEIFIDPRLKKGFTVQTYQETIQLLDQHFINK